MWLVVVSIVALFLGPALTSLPRVRGSVLGVVDGFVVTAMAGLLLLHVVPHAVREWGGLALASSAAGVVAPTLLERSLHRRADNGSPWPTVAAFAVHAFLDGVALVRGSEEHGPSSLTLNAVALAVILHRIPEGLAVWAFCRPDGGILRTVAALTAVAFATVVGALAGTAVSTSTDMGSAVVLMQSFVVGWLLHVVVHHEAPCPADGSGTSKRTSGLGAVAAIILLLALVFSERHGVAAEDAGLIDLATRAGASVVVAGLIILAVGAATRTTAEGVEQGRARALTLILRGASGESTIFDPLPRPLRFACRVAASSLSLFDILLALVVLGPLLGILSLALALLVLAVVAAASAFGPREPEHATPSMAPPAHDGAPSSAVARFTAPAVVAVGFANVVSHVRGPTPTSFVLLVLWSAIAAVLPRFAGIVVAAAFFHQGQRDLAFAVLGARALTLPGVYATGRREGVRYAVALIPIATLVGTITGLILPEIISADAPQVTLPIEISIAVVVAFAAVTAAAVLLHGPRRLLRTLYLG